MTAEQHVNMPEMQEELLAYEEILEEYRRRQMVEHLTGPMISLVVHIIVLVACGALLAGREIREKASPFDITDVELVQLEPEVVEQLEKIPEDEVVPALDRPELTPEEVNIEQTDFADVAPEEMDLTSLMTATDSPLRMPGLYQGRTKGGRGELGRKYGGRTGEAAERAVMKALIWLRDHQNPDGSWSPEHSEAMTGLGLLTFLAHGEYPANPESKEWGFDVTVQKAMQWLVNDMMSKEKLRDRGYAHGIATYALCEAYAMTQLPWVKPAAERGLTRIIEGQQPGGGWDYDYAKGTRWDLSVSAWQIQAMKAAYVGGLQVPGLQEALERAVTFLKFVTYSGGRFGYDKPGEGSWGMSGAGSLALQLLGEGKADEAKAAVDNIVDNVDPKWDDTVAYAPHNHPAYGWYYMTQATFHGGMGSWKRWWPAMSLVAIRNQKTDGHWECPGAASAIGAMDPYYSTTLMALLLSTPYRYLLTTKEQTSMVKATDVFDDI
jgi:hypothetical protein